ncbi:centrosomal protein of 162 kDa isoform X2 [Spea bombifrons]|uniref:centrosomal protein of 162 kDa isoform X2 n=1 Tax=Spea bombifrons TaxID=233779 RepID=UPI00234A6D2C|nr:centrosomal protein of 162 kDa isoform X2 [Spea bombifrons]
MAHRMSKEELDEQFEQFLKESLSDDSYESSRKPSILENIGKPKNSKLKKKDNIPWWSNGDDSDDGDSTLTNRSFLKSQRTSQPIREEEEDDDEHLKMQSSTQDPVCESIDRDSLDVDDSVVASGPNPVLPGIGLDTLEEQEEKERFFAKLEKGASSTIDYSKLNKELDSTDSSQFTAVICNNEKPKSEQKKNMIESKDLSGNYSEDFEEDAEVKSPKVQEKTGGMLAKVMLLDSLDSTIDTQKLMQQAEPETLTQQVTNEALGTGISNAYTNSDIEAIHQAYRNIDQSLEGSIECSSLTAMEQAGASLGDVPHSNEKTPPKMSTVESDIRTVDELMQPIRVNSSNSDYSEVKPVSLLMQTDYGLLQYKDNKAAGKVQEKQIFDYLHEWKSENVESRNNFSPSENEFSENKKHLIAHDSHRFPKGPGYANTHVVHQDKVNRQASLDPQSMLNHDVGSPQSKPSSRQDKSPTSLNKKPQNPHYTHVKSSGYGKASTHVKQPSLSGKLNSKKSPAENKGKSTNDGRLKGILSSTRTIRFAENTPTFPRDNSTESPAQQYYPQNDNSLRRTSEMHLGKDALAQSPKSGDKDLHVLERLQSIELKLNNERIQSEDLKAELSKREEVFLQELEQMKAKYEAELNQLKQENYTFQAKLHAEEEKGKKRNLIFGNLGEPVTEENVRLIRQEIDEQETLIKGYQQENERLYQQVKELQARNKQNEELMFQENQSLKADLVSLREQINKTSMHCQRVHYDSDSKNQNNTELMAELHVLQKRETAFLDEISRHKQEKQALEVDLAQMRKQRDLAKAQLSHTSGDKSYEMKIMEETYKQEINQLNKKLQWFAENQELLDKDAGRLRDAYDQIENLTLQVERLRHQAGNPSAQQQTRLKDRAADAKRIQDLERQVKEMEAIIKRRHPNSIPALIYAAAAASATETDGKSNTVVFLEKRIQKLEAALENKDEEAKKSLRSMEQQFQKIKIQYENRINELEGLRSQSLKNDPLKELNNTTKLKALEQELSIYKEAHQTTVTGLQKEIDVLKEKNAVLESKAMTNEHCASFNSQLDKASAAARLAKLNHELIAKRLEVQELSKTVERLQKERMTMLSLDKIKNKKELDKGKIHSVPLNKSSTVETFPGTMDEKLYHPGTFADSHISDIQQENDRLKSEVQRLSLEVKEQKTSFQKSLSHVEHTMQRLKEEADQKVATLKRSHQREMEKIICQHALEHSSSRTAQLSNTISTQEVLIKHLQTQVTELQKDREVLSVYRIREEALQKEMARLFEEFKAAKECQSPEMRQFLELENKIKHMELRHSQREQELQQIIMQTRHTVSMEQDKEVEKWKKLVHHKNVELNKFRSELDAILDVLRVLQRQGVVIPISTSEGAV